MPEQVRPLRPTGSRVANASTMTLLGFPGGFGGQTTSYQEP